MRDPSPYAGRTVKLRPDAAELGGHLAEVVDWYARTGAGIGWRAALEAGDPRAQGYAIRRGLGGLPDDDDVLMARVDGMGALIHVTEIEGATTPTPAPGGPKLADARAVGLPCPACAVPLTGRDMVAVILLGPGADPDARAAARAGREYPAVAVELHWACRTGDDSYTTEG